MQQNLPEEKFAANMYALYRTWLDCKAYSSPEEKAYFEQQMQAYEEYYLQVQPKEALEELGFTPINARGLPPPPAA